MKVTIEPAAMEWFRKEMDIQKGDAIRFFVRLGGCSTVQSGFSLGIAKEQPKEVGVSTVEDGVTFYIEKEDLWYLDNTELLVVYDTERDEISFR
ncbi:HesB/YadR/YfhF family protein [Aneurinibacillus sp. REN35]|uniref:HesB/YadR/YfhF family protein n=1 Tax=Aneurinibacillus sp. REN35 TaxID=3237286 RepID=UPI003529CD21